MDDIATNRDLYRFIADLLKRRSGSGITLASYLWNLRQLGHAQCSRLALPLTEFARLLEAAFEAAGSGDTPAPATAEGYADWETRIDAQIRDLHEMHQAGTLASEYRYFGVNAPSGARWYNFDPLTYIECAAAGTFGGWQEGDDTGRAHVPGPVAVLDASGAITTMDPRDIDDPVVEVPEITWRQFVEFLEAGQWYE
jgi:hypothetical protein